MAGMRVTGCATVVGYPVAGVVTGTDFDLTQWFKVEV